MCYFSSPIKPHEEKIRYRQRREAPNSNFTKEAELDNVNLYKTIVVMFPEEGALRGLSGELF